MKTDRLTWKEHLKILSAAIGTAAVISGAAFFVFRIAAIEPIYGAIQTKDAFALPEIILAFLGAFLVYLYSAAYKQHIRDIFPAALPLVLSAAAPLIRPGLCGAFFFILCLMWSLWLFWKKHPLTFPQTDRSAVVMTGIMAAAALFNLVWGYHIQSEAYARLYFRYTDWCFYFLGFLKHDLVFNSGHFNPLPNLLIGPLVAWTQSPHLLFFLHSVIITSAIPAWYYMTRCFGWDRFTAAFTGTALAFSFTLVNLHLSLFYGFHPVVLGLPLIMLFTAFRQKQRKIPALICFLLTLLVQETFAVFWFGYGMYLLSIRKFRAGTALVIFSPLWFLFIVKVLSPLFQEGFGQMFHYAGLGNNLMELALSPWTRPQKFFGELLDPANFSFLFLLAVPFMPFLLKEWKRILIVLPMFAGIVLADGNATLNVFMQYQTDFFLVFCTAAAAGMMHFQPQLRTNTAVVFAIGILLTGFFAAKLPWGKSSFQYELSFPARTAEIEELKSRIPEDAHLLVMPRFLIHFLTRPHVQESKTFEKIPDDADYLLFDFSDPLLKFSKRDLEKRAVEIAKEKKFRIIHVNGNPETQTAVMERIR